MKRVIFYLASPHLLYEGAVLGVFLAFLCVSCGAPEPVSWTPVGLTGGGATYVPSISPHDPNLMLITCDMSGAYRTVDGGFSWEMIHHSQLRSSTRCRFVFPPDDPNVILGANGYRGELRVSRDRGVTWEALGQGLPRGLVALEIDPANSDSLLAATRDALFFSTDGGNTWKPGSGYSGQPIGLHINERFIAATTDGVFISADGGARWEAIGEGLPDRELVGFAAGSNAERSVLYCTAGGVYRSTDDARTWQRVMDEGSDSDYTFVVTNDVDPKTVYVARRRPSQIYRSDDAGDTWRPTYFANPGEEGFNVAPSFSMAETGRGSSTVSGLGIDPNNADTVVMTDWFKVQITRDGGNNWQTLHTRSAEPERGLEKGQRWVNNGLVVTSVWHYYIDPFERHRHYMAYTDVRFARSEDSGETWISDFAAPLRNTTYELALDPEIPGKIWGAFANMHDIPNGNIIHGRHYREESGGGVGFSQDFAVTWRDSSQGLPPEPVTSIVLDPKSPRDNRTLYAALFEAGVFKSVDDGKTWTLKSTGLGDPEINMRACRLILHNDGTLFCLVTAMKRDDEFLPQGAGLFRSRDGAESWEQINQSQPLLWPKDYDVDPRDSNVIYLGAADANDREEGGLYKTTDGGLTWTRIAREGRQTFGATVHPKRPDWVYMCLTESAPGAGLWLSKDAGATWKPFLGLPFRNAQRVSFDPGDDSVIYVNTFGGSVYKGPAEE